MRGCHYLEVDTMRTMTVDELEVVASILAPLVAMGWEVQWHKTKNWAFPHLWCLRLSKRDLSIPFYGNSPLNIAREVVLTWEERARKTELGT